MAEYWDVYDKDYNLTGKIKLRGEPLSEGEHHRVVEIVTFNNKDEILVTFRDPRKPHGGLWEYTGGSILAGEDSLTAAKRELSEETGIFVTNENIRFVATYKPENGSAFFDIFVAYSDLAADKLVMQEGETIEAKWVTAEELKEMNRRGEVVGGITSRLFKFYDEICKEKIFLKKS